MTEPMSSDREEIVEAMARAIQRPSNVLGAANTEHGNGWTRRARAALTALEARGLVVVKVPPGHAIMFAKMDEPGGSSTIMLTASKDPSHD